MSHVNINRKPFEKLKSGVDDLANTVKETLGPNGRNILFAPEIAGGSPLTTRDGVTVSHFIKLRDPVENLGAAMVKQAAKAANDAAGDGTSTCVILSQAIFAEGLKLVAAGVSPIGVKRSIDEAMGLAIQQLKLSSREVVDIAHVASISANNDPEIGGLIAEGFNKVGKDGAILVEHSTKNKNYISFQEGMVVERGWEETSHYFMTNFRSRTAEYDNPEILIIEDKIHEMRQLEPVLRHVAKNKRPLIIMVRDIEDSVLAWIVANKLKGGMPIAVIKTPSLNSIELIDDIACRSGARYYHPDWNNISSFKPEDLGSAEKVIIGKSDTKIIQGRGDISQRLAELNGQVIAEEDEVSKKRLQDRINRLTSSVATLNITAGSEAEMKDLKLRIEDAINATRHALDEGVVIGGGVALLNLRSGENTPGEKILNKAFEIPFRYIVENAGENPEKRLAEIEELGDGWCFDAKAGKIVDAFKAGIIDPVKVTRTAIEKSVSVAGMLLLTGSCVTLGEDDGKK